MSLSDTDMLALRSEFSSKKYADETMELLLKSIEALRKEFASKREVANTTAAIMTALENLVDRFDAVALKKKPKEKSSIITEQ